MCDRGGMGAILARKYQDGWRPIYFTSRRWTDVESRWGQTELEVRAVKWGAAEKFGEFFVGAPTFQIFTDARVWFLNLTRQVEKLHPELKGKSLECSIWISLLYIAQVKTIQLILCQGTR